MAKKGVKDWFVYIIECRDGSLYTGIAKDVHARLAQHNAGKGAKYTRGRGPVSLRTVSGPHTQSNALSIEARVKQLPSPRKEIELKHGIKIVQ